LELVIQDWGELTYQSAGQRQKIRMQETCSSTIPLFDFSIVFLSQSKCFLSQYIVFFCKQ